MFYIRIVILSLMFVCSLMPCGACSPADFLLDEFSSRCKALANQVRDAELSRRMGFPDAASRSALLLDAWLSFYLDHGVTPPPIYASMAGAGWESGMRSLGTRIGSLGRGEPISPELLELMTLPFDLLARPDELAPFRGALATLSSRIDVLLNGAGSGTTPVGPAQVAADPDIGRSFALISKLCEPAPTLKARLSTLHTSLTASIGNAAPGSGSVAPDALLNEEDRRALLELHLGSVRDEVAFLAPLVFWQTQPAASSTSIENTD